jgi:ribosomal-protein-alanine N-acetyltransferase
MGPQEKGTGPGTRPSLEVVPATGEQLRLLLTDTTAFRLRYGVRVVPGFSQFDGTLEHSVQVLEEQRVPPHWSTHLFVHGTEQALIGIGGYTGPPEAGVVEIGYSIAPDYQGRGLGTAAAAELVRRAAEAGLHRVVAHTLAQPSPSTGVLRSLGFIRTDEIQDPDEGLLWRWERELP